MIKLKNRRGETIAETLVSLTIAAVGLVLLASMINASSKMIESSRESVKKYVAAENEITLQITEDKTLSEDEADALDTGTVRVYEVTDTGSDQRRLTDDEGDDGILVEYFVNGQARGDNVRAYNRVISYRTADEEGEEMPHDPMSGETEGSDGGD